jgi:hypothetical protein
LIFIADHKDATSAPTSDRETMLHAGMAAALASNCFLAKTSAKVGDFDRTSITKVFLEGSGMSILDTNTKSMAQAPYFGQR